MPDASVPAAVGGPLDDVNDAFHHAYDDARAQAEQDAPVFVVLADVLIVYRRGARQELPFTPRVFHVLKSVAHAPVTAFTLIHRGVAREAPAVSALRAHVSRSLAALDDDLRDARDSTGPHDALDGERTLADARAVLEATLALLEERERHDVTPDALRESAARLGPLLLRVTDHATRLQLAALHACVQRALAPLEQAEQAALQIVVAGAHQARARSLAMQYFQRRLCEPEGVEQRVTYGEGIEDEKAALALVGTRRLDRAIASAFFNDPRRLQRDILGDAAKTHLDRFDLPPIG